ncbi:unnamed protein product, partial [Orchesella dallaii]
MQSDRYFKIFEHQNAWASKLGASSFVFDYSKRTVIFNRKQHITQLFCFGIFTVHLIFILVRTINHFAKLEHFDGSHYYFLSCVSIAGTACWLILFLIISKAHEFGLGFNGFVAFLNSIQATYIPTFDKNASLSNCILDGVVFFTGPLFVSLAFVISLHAMIFQDWPMYFSSIFPANTPLIVYIINAIYVFWIPQFLYGNLMLFATIFVGFAPHLLTLFKEFIVNPVGDGRPMRFQMATREFRNDENLRVTYRRLQIMHGFEMDALAWSIMPIQGLLSYLIMYCVVSLIKHRHEMDGTLIIILVLWAALPTIDLYLLLEMSAKFYVLTKRALKSMKKKDWG